MALEFGTYALQNFVLGYPLDIDGIGGFRGNVRLGICARRRRSVFHLQHAP
jgi:hypothetical protein